MLRELDTEPRERIYQNNSGPQKQISQKRGNKQDDGYAQRAEEYDGTAVWYAPVDEHPLTRKPLQYRSRDS